MSNADFFDVARNRFRSGLAEFGHRWGWYLALGVFLVLLGMVATGMAVQTTVISMMALGGILLFAGAGLVVLSLLTARWSGFLLTLAAGVLSGITGITLLRAPLAGAASLTLVIAGFLMIAGFFRSIASIAMQFPNWGWSLVSGIVSVGLGVMLVAGWPAISLWFLGLYIGVDLILHGFSWIMFSSRVHALSRLADTTGTGIRAA